jgi:hypothetical protein
VTGYEVRQQRLVDAPPDITFQEWVGADGPHPLAPAGATLGGGG